MHSPALLLDLVCNRPLLAMTAQAVTYYNVLAGRIGAMGMIQPEVEHLSLYERHLTEVPARLGRGETLQIGSSRFAGNRTEALTGWRREEPYTMTPDGTAIIHAVGALVNRGAYVGASSGVTSYEGLDYSLERAAIDGRVKSIIVDVASPGGEAAGGEELARKIMGIRKEKPVFGIANALAASAGYSMLSACTEAYATPSSLVGSIGCIMLHLDRTEQAKNEGVVPTIIYAGDRKADGHAFQSLTPEALAELKAGVNSYYELFVKSVGAGRGSKLTAKMARDTQARTFVGAEGKTAGLIDDITTFGQLLSASDADNRRRSRRSASKPEGTSSMSSMLASIYGAQPQPVDPSTAQPASHVYQDGHYYVRMDQPQALPAPQPQPQPAPAAPPAPSADQRIAQAMMHPAVASNQAVMQNVMSILRAYPAMTADTAIGMALAGPAPQPQAPPQPQPYAAHPQPAPYQHAPYAPPQQQYPVQMPGGYPMPVAPPQPQYPAAGLPPAPAGYGYAISNGTTYLVPLSAISPQVTPQQALAQRVAATGVGLVPAGLGVSPTGVPMGAGFPQAPAAPGANFDQPGSITPQMGAAGWERALQIGNQRAAHWQRSSAEVIPFVSPDAPVTAEHPAARRTA